MSKKLNKKGFTLIEVVLVLAIGGLIFLLAFIAFQQVSRNRRDTQRRSDAGRIIAEFQNYKADRGTFTITWNSASGSSSAGSGVCQTGVTHNDFGPSYLCKNGLFLSPSGTNYNAVAYNSSAPLGKDDIKISAKAFTTPNDCSGNPLPDGGIKVEIGLENGNGATVCKDSQG